MSALIHLDSTEATATAGATLAQAVRTNGIDSLVMYLIGDLGVGKTTLARGFLRGLGHAGRVPSPTYALIEPYEIAGYAVSHIDLYRLHAPGEAASLALTELCGSQTLMLIEWPERGGSAVPQADLRLELAIDEPGRILRLVGLSPAGKSLIQVNK